MTPSEGTLFIITRDAVEAAARQRPAPVPELTYTLGGPIEAWVHSDTEAERRAWIMRGERALESARLRLRVQINLSSHAGYRRATFNARAAGGGIGLRRRVQRSSSARRHQELDWD